MGKYFLPNWFFLISFGFATEHSKKDCFLDLNYSVDLRGNYLMNLEKAIYRLIIWVLELFDFTLFLNSSYLAKEIEPLLRHSKICSGSSSNKPYCYTFSRICCLSLVSGVGILKLASGRMYPFPSSLNYLNDTCFRSELSILIISLTYSWV